MPLAPGDRLGPYEITTSIGKGGMGEVYRAHDSRLGRDVAIKVSAEKFSERFEREARAIAALNHPNICTLYDVGPDYLVMEYIEGEAPKGPLPLEEALRLARQITAAVSEAHEKNITHRDLKPGNIKIKPDGTVKVLDFGLAKVGRTSTSDDNATVTLGGTVEGAILGTAAYMSPEQARGQNVDKRSDIWAFGVVLYELLTGKRLFRGDTMADILAGVLKQEPDYAAVPFEVRRLLKSCLDKDPRTRLRDISDAWRLLDDAPVPVGTAVLPPVKSRLPWIAALTGALALVILAAVWWSTNRTAPETRWSAEWLGGSSVAFGPRISPDGQTLAFQAMVDSLTQVAVMKPDSGNWQVLTHDRTRGYVSDIAWAPDSAKLYFSRFQDVPRGIYSVPVFGGDERLVLEDAQIGEVLADGSMLIARLNAERRSQLHRYWPETGRLQPLNALLDGVDAKQIRTSPSGGQAVFYGTPLDQPDAPANLYAMDLNSEKTIRLAPDLSISDVGGLAISADGASVILTLPAGDATRVVSAPIDGSTDVRTLLTLTSMPGGLDAARDGALYLSQQDRTGEVLRLSLSGGTREYIALQPTGIANLSLPLPDGRIVFSSRQANRLRLMVAAAGKEPAPFVETQDQTSAPAAMVSPTQAAFLIGEGANRTIGFVSIADGRLTGRLTGPKGVEITSLAPSPDGRTIYYTASGSVWTVPVADGTPQKLRSGDAVTVDPYRNDLIVRLSEKDASRLVRVALTGGPERPILLQGGIRVAPQPLHPNAVGRDGRILAQITLPTSWFWPTGVIDPQTGRVEIINVGYDADMNSAGWTPDGKIVLTATPLRSSLWRWTDGSKK